MQSQYPVWKSLKYLVDDFIREFSLENVIVDLLSLTGGKGVVERLVE